MAVVSMRELLEAGVHFGHQTRRWNPKMKRFIFSERNGIYIIDIQQSIGMLEEAYAFLRDAVVKGGTVLFVGTKRQAQEAIEQQALRVGMPYVNYRWLGGMLTNFETIKTRLVRLRELESMQESGTMDLLPKKEVLMLQRERDKLQRNLGGIRTMNRLPAALWVVDTVREHIAVKEANRLGIPVVAVVDTNCDPDLVQYVVPGNDDAIRSGALLTRLVAEACAEGHMRRAQRTADDVVAEQAAAAAAAARTPVARTAPTGGDEPLAEWEIALQREEAARRAAQASGAVLGADGEQAGSEAGQEPADASESSEEAAEPPGEAAEPPGEATEPPADPTLAPDAAEPPEDVREPQPTPGEGA